MKNNLKMYSVLVLLVFGPVFLGIGNTGNENSIGSSQVVEISAAEMPGIGRTIGETITLMMLTGNATVIPSFPVGIQNPVRTMTATIALEMCEVPQGSAHFHALFAVGAVILIITLLINLISDILKKR